MPLKSPVSDIITETHDRFWNLPASIRKRKREEYNAYMRVYMREKHRPTRHYYQVELNDKQNKRLIDEANGRHPTPFLREAAFAYFDQRILLPKSLEEALAKATVEINRIGNSINQIAHRANIERHVTCRELERANLLLVELQRSIDRIIPSLSVGHHGR
jgi:hypothetical protein